MSQANIADRPFVIDHIVLKCRGCMAERQFALSTPLRSAEELIAWMKVKPTQCPCGAATCDVKARVADQN